MNQNLQKIYLTFGLFFLGFLFLNYSSDPPEGRTGAPGETTCGIGCHTGNTNNYTGSVTIAGIPTNTEPNTPYNVTVCVNNFDGNAAIAGYQFTAINTNGESVGTYSDFMPESVFGTKMVGGFLREYLDHDNTKPFVGGVACWSFTWTSPAVDGDFSFYAAGNIANGTGGTSGDFIVTESQINISLPVVLNYFDVSKKGNIALIEWETEVENESAYFEIEKSNDGVNFEVIHKMAASRESTEATIYRFEDEAAFMQKASYYRLKMVDFDGQFRYSDIKAVEFELEYNGVVIGNVFPNPVSQNEVLNFQLFTSQAKEIAIQIINMAGQIRFSNNMSVTSGENNITLPVDDLPNGIYNVTVFDKVQNQFLQHRIVVHN